MEKHIVRRGKLLHFERNQTFCVMISGLLTVVLIVSTKLLASEVKGCGGFGYGLKIREAWSLTKSAIWKFRYGELVFQVEEVFDHNQRLCLILLSWRERGGGHWKILKTSLRLPEAPFIPEMVAGFISLFLFFLRRIGNFQLTLPLGNGLTLFSRIQDISDPNHRNRNLHAIQIGTRSKTGYYLLFKARFK